MRTAFVGRTDELAEMNLALDHAARAEGGLCLLAGEAGIGKTRLADESARVARERGFTVVWGRCWEVGGAPAYWPWIQVLRGLVRERAEVALPARVREVLARIVPELRDPASARDARTTELDPAHARLVLFEAVTDALRAFSHVPLVLVLDDLHASDPSSLALLHFMTRELRTMAVLVLGTCRAHEARLSPERSDLFAKIQREATLVTLRRFDASEVRALVSRRMKEGSALVDEIVRATEGNPLFVEEVLRALASRSQSLGVRRAGVPIPDSIRESVAARAELLDGATRETLEIASVIGRMVPIDVLADVCDHVARAELERHLRTGIGAGVLAEEAADPHEFTHVLVRDAIYEAMDPERRAAAHARIAETLERGGGDVEEIAHHLLAGASAVGVERVFEGARRAAERAMRAVAFEDAAAIMTRTLAVLEPRLDDRQCASAKLVLGEALVRSGRVREGREVCAAVAQLARRLDDPEMLAAAGLAYGAEIVAGSSDKTMIGILEEALARLPTTPSSLRIRTKGRLAGALQPSQDPTVPVALAREAIAEARAFGDLATLRTVMVTAGSALVEYADSHERIANDEEMLHLALAAGDVDHALRARRRLVLDTFEVADGREIARRLAEYETQAAAARRPKHVTSAALYRAMWACYEGRYDEMRRIVDEVERSSPSLGEDGEISFSVRFHRAFAEVPTFRDVGAMRAGLDDIETYLISNMPGGYEIVTSVRALVAARGGDFEEARRILPALDLDASSVRSEPSVVFILGELVALLGDRTHAAIMLPRVAGYRSRFCTWGSLGWLVEGPYEMVEGMLHAVLGDRDAAAARFAGAIHAARTGGAHPALARASIEAALFMRSIGGDEAEAARRMEQGLKIARGLDMALLVARAGRPAFPIDAAVPSKPPSIPPRAQGPAMRFELVREGEIWAVTTERGTFRLKETRGLVMLAYLLERPGEEVHVLALGANDPGDLGDAGEVLDKEAVRAYRERIGDLREAEREADEFGDNVRAAKAREEIEALAREIAGGVGLGGRHRKAAAAAQRARVNVQRRLKDAIDRIKAEDLLLGQYLGWTVKTGIFCAYRPPAK